ncbi:hypothetical protein CLV31_1324 [Algoriphagus aquaeductus]|uniref:Uncharacterized protein n=1 Tax=Algoriphagus aquaeductus TaxID=475299 RepID=A0A326RJV3_9BACT|nr:hypothetical protein CLV31_1324 [Algoriphagus aquaeductus]
MNQAKQTEMAISHARFSRFKIGTGYVTIEKSIIHT